MIKYSSRYPLSIILGLSLDIISLSTFLDMMIFNQLPIVLGLFYTTLCLTLIDLIICPYAGKISLTDNEIIVKYFFPWRSNITLDISEITSIETTSIQYKRFFSKVYLTTKTGLVQKIYIQSGYKSMEGVKVLESEFYKIKKINPLNNPITW